MIPSSTTTIVSLQRVCKTYPKGEVALKSVDLSITEQEIIGIVGANGAGKSTLLKAVAGRLKPEQGRVYLFQLNANQHVEQFKQDISYISQDRALDPEMTGQELMQYFSALYGLSRKKAWQRCDELTDLFEMSQFINRRTKTYSGGQAQRLHLAIGMIHQPKLLLLDEPTSALDPKGASFFWDFIKRYQQQGHTVVVISHELERIREYCSRVWLLEKGTLIADGTPSDIIQTHAMPVLQVKVTRPLEDNASLTKRLQQIISVETVQWKGRAVKLTIKQEAVLNKAEILRMTLAIFESQTIPVVECRWDDAGLENAYFKLTGESLNVSSVLKKSKKGQGKNR